MTKEEIAQIYKELSIRGLVGDLQNAMRYMRNSVSRNTIIKAFRVDSLETATPLQQRIIETGKEMLQNQMQAA